MKEIKLELHKELAEIQDLFGKGHLHYAQKELEPERGSSTKDSN